MCPKILLFIEGSNSIGWINYLAKYQKQMIFALCDRYCAWCFIWIIWVDLISVLPTILGSIIILILQIRKQRFRNNLFGVISLVSGTTQSQIQISVIPEPELITILLYSPDWRLQSVIKTETVHRIVSPSYIFPTTCSPFSLPDLLFTALFTTWYSI